MSSITEQPEDSSFKEISLELSFTAMINEVLQESQKGKDDDFFLKHNPSKLINIF